MHIYIYIYTLVCIYIYIYMYIYVYIIYIMPIYQELPNCLVLRAEIARARKDGLENVRKLL